MSPLQDLSSNSAGGVLVDEALPLGLGMTMSQPLGSLLQPKKRKRDIIRQVSVRILLSAHDLASSALQGIFRQRIQFAEDAIDDKNRRLDLHVPPSRRRSRTQPCIQFSQDDASAIQRPQVKREQSKSWSEFFLSRVTDPTSFFFKYRFNQEDSIFPRRVSIHLVSIHWLKPHEDVVSMDRVIRLKHAIIKWHAYLEPLLVDRQTGAILDGHHRYNVGLQLNLTCLPVVLVDYLDDDSIKLDVWESSGKSSLMKQEVIDMALSQNVFPPKTSKHTFMHGIPPITVPLDDLKQHCSEDFCERINTGPEIEHFNPSKSKDAPNLSSPSLVRHASIQLLTGATTMAFSALQGVFRHRIRTLTQFFETSKTKLDVVNRTRHEPDSLFTAIRKKDPSSAFCQQSTLFTLEDLLNMDGIAHRKFFLTRVTDPTSYFYKFRWDIERLREPKRVQVHLVAMEWLKEHEHVVSWERVEKLRHATVQWDAYLEPLLVDIQTGAILDGHHRYNVGKLLNLARIPAVLVDYLNDDSITVDVWPNCGLDRITKEMVIEMSLSSQVFPPKTSRHAFSDDLPPISIPLKRLRMTAKQEALANLKI